MLQFVDAWTNKFAYIGRRATGTSEGEFLLAADGWAGEAPAGMRLVSAPTGVFMIVGRVQVDGAADLPAVHALQDQFTITPLSVRDGGPVAATPGAPRPDPRVREDLQWWERLRVALVSFPPPQADARFVEHAASQSICYPANHPGRGIIDKQRATTRSPGSQHEEIAHVLGFSDPAGPASHSRNATGGVAFRRF